VADIKIAITKGRLLDNSIALFERAGYDCSQLKIRDAALYTPYPIHLFRESLPRHPML